MKKDKIEKILVSMKFVLKKGNYKICATKDRNDNISLYRHDFFNEDFCFKNSTPETLKAIGELIIEASNL